jgi:coproporphyrinogen III oxidase
MSKTKLDPKLLNGELVGVERREALVEYLKSLRSRIIRDFETLEKECRFERKSWSYSKGSGGGEMSVIRGDVFEKAAVNFSAVQGEKFPGQDAEGAFFATGVSLITHMRNPWMPTVHFNIRYIEAGSRFWFGGGYDLTPMGFDNPEDTESFHNVARSALDAVDPKLYPVMKEAAREYFTIPHYQRERGVGGIFFDHYNTGDFKQDLKMWTQVGETFLDAVMPIYRRKTDLPWTPADKDKQIRNRAYYVEFNLLYDRGTRFGFQSGGNPEAILCSMPPLAAW